MASLIGAVLVGGIGTLAIVVSWMRLFPALARVDRLEGEPTQRRAVKPIRA